jgi:SAM-dependent methyltransferase
MIHPESDLLGIACKRYFADGDDQPIRVFINGKQDSDLLPSYFFRKASGINSIERAALAAAKGNILDIGAGAGCHSVILQERGAKVVSLEKSPALCEIIKNRGIRQVVCCDVLQYRGSGFDTILLLMNGFGLAGTDIQLEQFIGHLVAMLRPGGSVIGDSTDIAYFYRQTNQAVELDLNAGYFGNVVFQLNWQGQTTAIPWLFADEWLLRETCEHLGLKFSVIRRGSDHQFLCRITKP